MKVYLCGPINGRSDDDCKGWREYAKERLPTPWTRWPGLPGPRAGARHRRRDRGERQGGHRGSDVLLVYYDKPSVGTAMEIRMAVKEMGQARRAGGQERQAAVAVAAHHCPERYKSLDEAIAACK
jgi:hypothetical protein